MATNYKTLTFSGTNQVWSTDETGAAAYFRDGNIYLFYPVQLENVSKHSMMYIHANAASNLAAQGSWSGATLFQQPFVSSSHTPAPASSPAAVATADTLYLFWCDQNENSLACSALGWTNSLKILDTSGNTIDTSNREVAACQVGGVLLVATTDTDDNSVHYYTLRPQDIDASNGHWKAHGTIRITDGWFVSTSDPMSKAISIVSSMAYIDGVATPVLVQSLQYSKKYYLFVIELDSKTGLPKSNKLGSASIGDGMTGGAMLARDPAGRVRYYYADGDGYVKGGRITFCDGGQYKLTFGSPSRLFGDDKLTATPPCGVFVPVLTDGSGSVNRWTMREVVFRDENTGDDTAKVIKLQMADYGTVQKTANPSQDFTAAANKVQLLGYILSPPPLAVQNYTGKTSNYPFTAGGFTYGQNNSGSTKSQTSVSGSVGIGVRASAGGGINLLDILDMGAEIKGESSITYGMESTTGTSSSTTTSMELATGWEVRLNDEGQPEWAGQGYALYRNIVIGSTTYDFIDDGASAPATNAYSNVVFSPQDTSLQIASFRTWLVNSDDLSTYTEDAYTTSMSNAGLYSGGHYIRDVIAPNAITYDATASAFTSSSGAQPGLPFSWGNGATILSDYAKVDTSFTESAWSLDASYTASLSGDFSLIVSASAEVWTELKTTLRSVSSSELSSEWGIKLSIDVPMAEQHGVADPIYAYTGTMYFCPPPTSGGVAANRWTEELVTALRGAVTDLEHAVEQQVPWDQIGIGPRIDASSQCWKVCFTVANVYRASTQTTMLVTDGYLTEGTAKRLSAQGLDTMGKVAKEVNPTSLKDLEAAAAAWLGKRS